ncbi:MAG: tRNA (guanosine(46)-N7)-methyltransferase TrmB [Gammaproteobacteria bacterium]
MTEPTPPYYRGIRSFVLREGRMTASQQRALDTLLPRYALPPEGTLDLRESFDRIAPVCLEIGTGNGDNLLACATAHPENNYIAAEVHRPGIGHLLNGIARACLRNVRVWPGDVQDLLARLPAESLDMIYVFFPDPWPKARHHKRRLLQGSTWGGMRRCLARHGRLYVATDWANYAEDIAAEIRELSGWRNLAGRGVLAPRPCQRILTRFESRALGAGRAVHDFILARRD